MSDGNVLPDCRGSTGAVPGMFGYMVPIFCASCNAPGGLVPEENMTYCFWLCNPCFAKYGELTNVMVMPDEVFYEKVKQAQIEKYGRFLTAEEIVVKLADPESLESLLARSRAAMTPKAGS